MAGKKRSINGQVKPHAQPKPSAEDTQMTDATPLCGQPAPPSSKSASTPTTTGKPQNAAKKSQEPFVQEPKPVSNPTSSHSRKERKKLAKLPNNTRISKRPLLHPAIPTPYAAAHFPKTLYITASTPYIPCLKRIRKLLAQISKREAQSVAAQGKGRGRPEANGRLEARDVERGVVEGSKTGGSKSVSGGGEEVYLKATGRAIPRALEIGVYFQAQGGWRVGVDMGSVSAVDDVEVVGDMEGSEGADADGDGDGDGADGEDVPETRIRMLSSVTISIGLE